MAEVIRGFREFLPELRAGNHTLNNDGTYEFDQFGKGNIFIPSALGYYSKEILTIPKYSPLIFSVALHKMNQADMIMMVFCLLMKILTVMAIRSMMIRIMIRIPNYRDSDDDGDGTSTKKEYDRDLDGVPDDDDQGRDS